jgi:alpha-methylacyl-CoA racemase
MASGPLSGVKAIEFGGIGPSPMCAMLLADLGATVLRLDRPEASGLGIEKPLRYNLLLRGRPCISVDLKNPDGVAFAGDLVQHADILIEGFRPGVMERIGLGPKVCLMRNPKLVYGRMTGWGQDGPLSSTAGHDLNYIALTGALDAIGRKGCPPTPPLNLVGDFGGGALYLAFGLMAALVSARSSGKGQVVDAAMVDGVASLMTTFFGLQAAGLYKPERGTNVLDSGAPYYDVYECADGRYLAVAPIEMKFRREFLNRLGLLGSVPDGQDPASWPELRKALTERIKSKTQSEWVAVFDGSDACVTPVLTMAEAIHHPHNIARNTFVNVDGVSQPAPAPRFGRETPALPLPPQLMDADVAAALAPWGLGHDRIADLAKSGAITDRGQ